MVNLTVRLCNIVPYFRDTFDDLPIIERSLIFLYHNQFKSLFTPEISKLSGTKGYYFDKRADQVPRIIAISFIIYWDNFKELKKLQVTERILEEL